MEIRAKQIFIVSLTLFLVACGSSGDTGTDLGSPADSTSPPSDSVVAGDTSADQGGSDQDVVAQDGVVTGDEGGEVVENNEWTVTQELLPGAGDFVLRSVWGSSGDSIRAVGQDGAILHRSMGEWSVESEGNFPYFHGISGVSADNIMAVGMMGARVQYDGSEWIGGSACDSDASCNDSNDCTVDICVAHKCQYFPQALPGCCGLPALEEDFDGTAPNIQVTDLYATDVNNGGVVWQIVSNRSASTPNSLYFGIPDAPCLADPTQNCPTYGNEKAVGATAAFNGISLPISGSITLEFQLYMHVESGAWDMLSVEASAGAAIPTEVWSKIELNNANGMTGGFVTVEVDLSAFSGQVVSLIFKFDTKDNFGNDTEGVYIDNLKIRTECSSGNTDDFGDAPTFFDVSSTPNGRYVAVGLNGAVWKYDANLGWRDDMKAVANDWLSIDYNDDTLLVGGVGGNLIEGSLGGLSSPDTNESRNINDVLILDNGARIAVGDSGLVMMAQPGLEYQVMGNSPGTANLYGVAARHPGDITIVGQFGTIWHFDGDSFQVENSGTTQTLNDVALEEFGQLEVAVGATGTILENTGSGWSAKPKVNNDDLYALAMLESETVIAVGEYGTILHRNAGTSTFSKIISPVSKSLKGVHAFTATDVYAVGLFGTLLHWDGADWKVLETPFLVDYNDVTGKEPSTLYIVGAEGAVLQMQEGEFEILVAGTSATLRSVFALDDQNIWAVGEYGTIMYSSGGLWARQTAFSGTDEDGNPTPFEGALYGVWASSSNDAWAVGADGVTLHFDGGAWNLVEQKSGLTLRAVNGWGEDDVLAAGTVGNLNYFDGSWHPFMGGTVSTLHDIMIIDDTRALVVGDAGTVLLINRP
jgi:hypothetical protein